MKQVVCVVSIFAIVVFLALIGYIWIRPKENYAPLDSEGYSNIGDVDNVGSLDDSHEIIRNQENAEYYAKLVSNDELSNYESLPGIRPMERLERMQGSDLLPKVSRNVTPYNVDIADPKTHSYMVNPPRVQLKDPIAMLADPFRGDIPITYHPDISLINRTRYGRDSLRLDGFFSSAYVDLYNKYTGRGFKNLPQKVVNEEVLMDYV
jgi:hypothetical protein